VFLIGACTLMAIFGSALPKSPPSESDAKFICQKFVTDRLRAPATAQFPSYSEQKASKNNDGSFIVVGYVDAQNGFGANIRTYYGCTVMPKGNDGNWTLVNLEM
jgi:hypothetical protein